MIIKTGEEPIVTELINLQTEEPFQKEKQTNPQELKV